MYDNDVICFSLIRVHYDFIATFADGACDTIAARAHAISTTACYRRGIPAVPRDRGH